MRTNHFVTVGLSVGLVTLGFAAASCGTDTFGTCQDTNSCGPGGEGGADGESDGNMVDMGTGETGPTEGGPNEGGPKDGGGDVVGDGPGMQCEGGLHDCNGKCVNEGNDTNNCGMCGKVCPGPDGGMGSALCDNGACQVMCNGTTGLNCNGVCYDPHDPMHCGSCSNACTAPANGMATCTGTTPMCDFTCDTNFHKCSGQCLADGDDPSNDPCVVADGLGIFVSPSGSDASPNDGTKEMPFATIAHAADVAAMGKKRVYACGTFTSAVALTSADDGVTIYGGLDCTTWAYSISTPTKVAPTTAGYALQVTGAGTNGVTFKDFTFTAQSAPQTPPANTGTSATSSVAIFASASKVSLSRVTITAGSGQPGAGGLTASNWSGPAPAGNSPAVITTGGVGGHNTSCADTSTSSGGNGGGFDAVNTVWESGQNGTSMPPVPSPNSNGGNGGNSCTAGTVGASGAAISQFGSGATSTGSVGPGGWIVGSNGGDGAVGKIAQGGGGGGGSGAANGGAGSGGGAGGCGGGKGLGGATGGSSIGILSYQATLALTSVMINAAAGGAGGGGGAGQDGQAGGNGAAGVNPGSCAGGNGGGGSGGSGAGGGAGGSSIGIAWTGATPPSVDASSMITPGTAGAFGPGGTGGMGGAGAPVNGTQGNAGTSAAVVQF